MLTVSFVFAVLLFLLLLLFFTGLPDLRFCRLPFWPPEHIQDDPSPVHGAEGEGLPAAPAGGTEERHAAGSAESPGQRRRSHLALLLLTLLYAGFAFFRLGNIVSPQTFVPMAGSSAVLDFGEPQKPVTLMLFPGVGQGEYSIEFSADQEGWYPETAFTQDHVAVLKWQVIPIGLTGSWRYMRIHCTSGTPWLGELQVLDVMGNSIPFSCDRTELTDEPETVPAESDFLNSSYFDEIYHARTAWEHLHGIWPYEISHPPLGKEILSLGILLFGMTPFGWRFSGTLIGVLMLPLMYALLRRLFGGRRIPFLGTVLLAADFMHYAQTRIATIDSYAVFFILLMYFFMLGWLRDRRLRDLALCGVSFGLGAAAKWICLYAGAGLGVLWLGDWIARGLHAADSRKTFPSFLRNCGFCVLFFLLIPALIYYLSYIPYGIAEGTPVFSGAYTKLVLDNQSFMFSYHAHIQAEHPYSSRWYQWLLDIRPILYYLQYLPEGRRVSIAAFVNPMLCWGGLVSLILLLYPAVFRRDRTAAFLLVGWLSGILPWVFISRLTFEYHYFASATFLIPVICYIFFLMEKNTRRGRLFTSGFTLVTALLFCCFFPILNGLPVLNELATRLLAWLPTWPI